jgi:hypothetical protein
MEMSPSNSLYNYPKQTKVSFFKSERQEDKRSCLGVGTRGAGGGHKEKMKRENMVEILCIHV